jgi:hypothetical protein
MIAEGIDPRDLNTGREQFSQPFLDLAHKLRVTAAYRNGMPSHLRKVVGREGEARNPTRVDLKCTLLAQLDCPCPIHE